MFQNSLVWLGVFFDLTCTRKLRRDCLRVHLEAGVDSKGGASLFFFAIVGRLLENTKQRSETQAICLRKSEVFGPKTKTARSISCGFSSHDAYLYKDFYKTK
jgi:hypothetical protein